MDDFLYQTFSFTPASLLFGLLLVFGRGGGGSDIFGFCLLLVLISPLPLAFIQQRGQNNLFIPLTGWAILVGTLSWTLIRTITPANLLGGRPARVVRIVLVTLLIALWRRDRNWRAKFSVDAVAEQQRADLGRDPTIAQPTCEAPSADPGCCCCMILSRTGICSLLLRYGLTILALILFFSVRGSCRRQLTKANGHWNGYTPNGTINGKMIVCESLIDQDAFPGLCATIINSNGPFEIVDPRSAGLPQAWHQFF